MAKSKSVFVCQQCGYESSGWMGKCPACTQWNTFVEEAVHIETKSRGSAIPASKPVELKDAGGDDEERTPTGLPELDRVLGGGAVRGSLVLVGGDPGIGKSTLLLQLCETYRSKGKILYVSGEELVSQIKMRADRLGVTRKNLMLVTATELSDVAQAIEHVKPVLVIIDSIQTMHSDTMASAPGSVGQVRDVTASLVKIAKTTGITIMIVGHVTKEGTIAGPRVLEHMVDTVLYFEGDRNMNFRILRAVKNRYGSTNEIGIFEMRDDGLAGVENPSEVMLAGRPDKAPGSVIVSSLEGTRPILIEVQALLCESAFGGNPRRMATGVDYNRITMLMAVLEKRAGLQLYNNDAYVNAVGGVKIFEPACDLGIAAAVASSFRNRPVDRGIVVIGEVGLAGEIRAVSQIDKRIGEAMRTGFTGCIIPKDNFKAVARLQIKQDFEIKTATNINEALSMLF